MVLMFEAMQSSYTPKNAVKARYNMLYDNNNRNNNNDSNDNNHAENVQAVDLYSENRHVK